MDVNGLKPQFYHPSEPLPVPSLKDIVPFPNSPEEQSFVIIRSAAELDNLSDDNDVSSQNASILSVNKQLIEEELRNTHYKYASSSPRVSTPDETDSEVNTEPVANGFQKENGESLMTQSELSVDGLDDMDTVKFSKGDFGSQEIEFKVNQLILQNNKLKDTIKQNSKTMENQKQKIAVWQEKSKEVHEAHREKLLEAKTLIDTLKKEKAALKAKIASLEAENEIINTPTKGELDVANNKVEELEALVAQLTLNNPKDITIKKLENSLLQAQTTILQLQETEKRNKEEIATLVMNNKGLLEKIARYDKELENCYRQIKDFQEQNHAEETIEVEELKLLKDKLFTSEMTNDRMHEEIKSLRSHLARNVCTVDTVGKLESDLKVALSERDRMVAELDARNSLIVDLNSKVDEMNHKLLQAESKAQHDLRLMMEREEQANVETWKAQQRIAELEQQLQLVQKNLEAKAQQVLCQQSSNPDEITCVRQQLVQTHLTLADAVEKKAVADAQLKVARKEIENLTRQLTSNESTDELFALKEQLEQFKADFNAEKTAKEEEKARAIKLSEDLQQVHRRNQQLQEEIELLRPHGFTAPRAPPSTSSGSHTSSPELQRYTCPFCNMQFRSERMITEHLDLSTCHDPW